MLARLKLFKSKKSYCEPALGANISQKYRKTTASESLFNKAAGKFFTGDCFSNLLELLMVFGPVKKSRENV